MKRLLVTLVVVAVGWLAQQAGIDLGAFTQSGSSTSAPAPSGGASAPLPGQRGPGPGTSSEVIDRIEEAVAKQQSGFMVTVDARVAKTLRDDLKGSRHQRFLIELDNGRTLLVAHNIDLADRVDLEQGDSVRVRGQYEYNDRGGVLHWTHHDPKGRREGGWIEHAGLRVK